ncbi:hypothetical protein [Paraburkholderia sediminicola]|uniref:hypothetical protein n=1 Tax=Paraburkholderia sediminicola TaxID=458836 RepID=UPI0038BCB750
MLNRMAVALAADSAVTHSTVVNGERKISYASGANKIFQLSSVAPVGVMLFNNATLQDIPWELLIKSFRASLGSATKDSVNEYAVALQQFVETNQALFPAAHREQHFKKLAARAALSVISDMERDHPTLMDVSVQQTHAAEFALFETTIGQQLAAATLPRHFDAQDLTDARNRFRAWLSQEIFTYVQTMPKLQHLAAVIQQSGLTDIVIECVYKFYAQQFDGEYTGIVVAGFGDNDYFPAFVELRYFGFVLDRLVVDEVSAKAIDHQTDSLIEPFAKKAMVETFLTGFAPEVWSIVAAQYREKASALVTSQMQPNALQPGFDAALTQSVDAFQAEWVRQVLESHYKSLRDVISGLPPNEMAELAETLVMLESFKEKVTQRTQSVGGPVDVAVVTRAEGLVWIKRKHYFDPQLNQRYFVRQSRTA